MSSGHERTDITTTFKVDGITCITKSGSQVFIDHEDEHGNARLTLNFTSNAVQDTFFSMLFRMMSHEIVNGIRGYASVYSYYVEEKTLEGWYSDWKKKDDTEKKAENLKVFLKDNFSNQYPDPENPIIWAYELLREYKEELNAGSPDVTPPSEPTD